MSIYWIFARKSEYDQPTIFNVDAAVTSHNVLASASIPLETYEKTYKEWCRVPIEERSLYIVARDGYTRLPPQPYRDVGFTIEHVQEYAGEPATVTFQVRFMIPERYRLKDITDFFGTSPPEIRTPLDVTAGRPMNPGDGNEHRDFQ